MEAAKPASPPGTKGAYHSQTYVALVSGLFYKITGEPIAQYFRRELAEPGSFDIHLDLPEHELSRTADLLMPAIYYPIFKLMGVEIDSAGWGQDVRISAKGLLKNFRYVDVCNGESLARIMGMAGNNGCVDGVRLFSEEVTEGFNEVQWTSRSRMPLAFAAMTMGWARANSRLFTGPNPEAFITAGAGGSIGLCDPERRLGIGYAQTRWHTERMGTTLGSRANALINAVYDCL